MFYDPMIAKLITWAPTRERAIDEQITALDRFEIEGPGTNLDFLSALMQHPRFRSGEITTGFIAEEYPEGFSGAPASDALRRKLAGLAATIACTTAGRAREISGQLGDDLSAPFRWTARIGGRDYDVDVSGEARTILVDGEPLDVEHEYHHGVTRFDAVVDGEALSIRITKTRTGFRLSTRGASHDVRILPAHIARYTKHLIEKVPPDLSRFLLAPMPGLLVRLDVAAGDRVEAGQPLAVVEAMKMENILRAGKSGTVKAVEVQAGESLAVDQVILELE